VSAEDDPFSRLRLPRRFRVSESEIRERLRSALGQVHPDRAVDPVARALALRESAAISAAARCLLDPRSRAEVLIRAAGADPAPAAPPALAMEMLEWRERVEEAKQRGDPSEAARERATIAARIEQIRTALAEAIDGAAEKRPGDARAGGGPGSSGARGSGPGSSGAPIADPIRAGALLTELRLVERLLEQAGEP